MRLYNTLTGRKDPLKPVTEGKVGIYACGPTVYDYFHIGNARVFIFFDVLRRYLDYRGYSVTFVQNYTDIDDKMINKAREMGISVKELADIFIQAYEDDTAALGILPADHHPRATEHIPQIIDLIRRLIDKNLAYDVDGDIFYHVGAFPDYGQLSHQDLEELVSGVRVEIDQRKKHPMDFALWKREKAGEPSWESPWGRGRPGWHIECSAMSMHFLGETLDIHGGGQDLIFPHHENEIAQSQGATGKPFARHWVHVGYLNLEREKMSKSLGNVLTVRDLRKTIDPLALRFFMLSAHYRNPINFSREYLEQAAKGMERLNKVIYNLKDRLDKVEAGTLDKKESDLLDMLQDYREKFIAVMDDDLNTAEALAVLFELAKTTNTYLNRPEGQKKNVLEPILNFYLETDTILGFIKNDSTVILEKELEKLIAKREEYRRQKDWAAADAIRDKLKEQGIILEDTPQGVRWKVDEKKNARQRKI
ncbi:MAG TPA: cysteine--tRNA ligase [Firmicutes bacterium]|nr:cysteine--tRNA ligase [Bacillota bacterium]